MKIGTYVVLDNFLKVALEFEYVISIWICLHDEKLLFAKMKYVISLHDYLLVIFLLIKIFLLQSNKKKMRLLFLFNPHFSSHAHKDKNDTNVVKADWNILPTFSKRNEVISRLFQIPTYCKTMIQIHLEFDLNSKLYLLLNSNFKIRNPHYQISIR